MKLLSDRDEGCCQYIGQLDMIIDQDATENVSNISLILCFIVVFLHRRTLSPTTNPPRFSRKWSGHSTWHRDPIPLRKRQCAARCAHACLSSVW